MNDCYVLSLKSDTHHLLQSSAHIVDEGAERMYEPYNEEIFGRPSYGHIMTLAFANSLWVELPLYVLHKTSTLNIH